MAKRKKLKERVKSYAPPRPQGRPVARIAPPQRTAPFVPATRPPAGTYNPDLDAEERASGRGLADLTQDTDRDRERGTSDYLLARGNTTRERDEGLADIGRVRDRGLEDYGTQRTQGLEDYGTTRTRGLGDLGLQRTRGIEDYDRQLKAGLEDLGGEGGADYGLQRKQGLEDYGRQRGAVDLNYGQLGGRQAQQINQAGAGNTSGAFAQAAAKRAANQARDLEPIATNENRLVESTTQAHAQQMGRGQGLADRMRSNTALGKSRLLEDTGRGETRLVEDTGRGESRLVQATGRGEGRLREDTGLSASRLREGTDRRLGALGTQFQRSNEDRDTGLTRAQRENTMFGQDVGAQRFFQAAATGYPGPPAPPKVKKPKRRPGMR